MSPRVQLRAIFLLFGAGIAVRDALNFSPPPVFEFVDIDQADQEAILRRGTTHSGGLIPEVAQIGKIGVSRTRTPPPRLTQVSCLMGALRDLDALPGRPSSQSFSGSPIAKPSVR